MYMFHILLNEQKEENAESAVFQESLIKVSAIKDVLESAHPG